MPTCGQTLGQSVKWDSQSLFFDGKRVVPIMGEIHYSRIPAEEWKQELQKMKAGGVTIIANYVFWNHVEEEEGIFNWSGQRSLRHFLELCKEEGLPVVLRIGPFCHGEARGGGIPDWIVARKDIQLRTEDPKFLHYIEALYRQIYTQAQGLLWKDGGPVVACQFDNEYGGEGSYLVALKRIAQKIGFDLPFYTRTGWPELKSPVPYGEMIPLYGDYADGFWDRSLEETTGNYWRAFNFNTFRKPTAIATEQLKNQKLETAEGEELYPYFTCELGGGMMTSYHRRIYIYPEDAYSLAIVKLGSGSNLLGYYMYHGGTNPEGKTYLNEMQRTPYTNWNDLPVKTYDFQAPLGEFGQKNPHYYTLRKLHAHFRECLQCTVHVFQCMSRRRDNPEHQQTLRYYRIGNHGAEYPVVFAEIHYYIGGLRYRAFYEYRSHTSLCRPYVETEFPESVLKRTGNDPQFPPQFVSLLASYDFQTFETAFHDRHRKGLGIYLGTQVITEVIYDIVRTCNKASDYGHRFGKGPYIKIYAVHAAEMLGSTAPVFSHHAETVGIVYHDAEIVFLLQFHNLVENAECAGHAVYAFSDKKHSAACLFTDFQSPLYGLLAFFYIVMRIHHALALVQAAAVDKARMGFRVVDNHIVTRAKRVDGGNDALIAEIEQERIFLLLEIGKLPFHALVQRSMAAHHTASHRIGQTPPCSSLSVHLPYFGMVRKAEVVVQAPTQDFLAVESHVRAYLPFQFRIHEIAESPFSVLPERTSRILLDPVENICHNKKY